MTTTRMETGTFSLNDLLDAALAETPDERLALIEHMQADAATFAEEARLRDLRATDADFSARWAAEQED